MSATATLVNGYMSIIFRHELQLGVIVAHKNPESTLKMKMAVGATLAKNNHNSFSLTDIELKLGMKIVCCY